MRHGNNFSAAAKDVWNHSYQAGIEGYGHMRRLNPANTHAPQGPRLVQQ